VANHLSTTKIDNICMFTRMQLLTIIYTANKIYY